MLGENVELVIFFFKGLKEFCGGSKIFYFSCYWNGMEYEGKKVFVVGCGNMGMEIVFDLVNFGVYFFIVVCSLV